jgi:hypothetical protein
VSGQHHTPAALTLRKIAQCSLNAVVGPQSPSGNHGEKFLSLRTPIPRPSSPSLYRLKTEGAKVKHAISPYYDMTPSMKEIPGHSPETLLALEYGRDDGRLEKQHHEDIRNS